MKSVMTPQQQFAKIEKPQIERSTFDRSHGYKTTLDAGKLIPVFIDEALPGDTFNLKATMFGRMSTPLKPIMDNIFIDLHFFSVPMRLVWENWQKFNGEQENPDDSTNFLIPTMVSPEGGYQEQSIYDYLGLPTKVTGIEHSSLPLRAINLIYNEWYRDQNLQDSVPVPKGDGPDLPSLYKILPRGKRKDYFTSALPWAQKSEPVSIPLGDRANVFRTEGEDYQFFSSFRTFSDSSTPASAANTLILRNAATLSANGMGTPTAGNVDHFSKSEWDEATKPPGETRAPLYADLSDATATTVNALREAFQIQKMYEKDARGGTRYTELIRAHFGVISPDSRLQRPEYLGGGSSPINITPVPQQSATTEESTPLGNLGAMGTFNINNNGFVKSFTEHEIVIGLVSVRADLNYQQGLHKMWSRKTRFDFYWPSFAHLGEQAILNKEIYCNGDDEDEQVFGYQERFAEYRYKPSQITGKYRSNADQSLDIWHLAQDFELRPHLNDLFIEENPPIARVIAVPTEPQFLMDCFFNYKTARPMPTFATPGLIDHF